MASTEISASQRDALERTIELLERIITMIRLDPGSRWLQAFKDFLDQARELRDGPATRQDLIDLSVSIMSVYGGMGSFNDYAPGVYDPATGRYAIPRGTEGFEQTAADLHASAMELREPRPIG